MPVNRNALIRYKTIDACLRNRRRKWTLDMLIDKVSEALYEYEGIDKGISRRTVQADIQMMRSDKLGYNAPIVIAEKKYYTYEDPEYSITNIPLSPQDLERMNEAVEVLKQFKGFSHFSSLNEVVQKLEDHVYTAAHHTRSVIEFEKNEQLKGLEYLDLIYNAVIERKAVEMEYRSFKAREANTFFFHVWWLKEFKNRWFAVGIRKEDGDIVNLALDRIVSVKIADKVKYLPNNRVAAADFYKDVIGVTVSRNQRPSTVLLEVTNQHAPYIETKPLHHSQQVLKRWKNSILVQIKVQLNFELEKEIMGFGDGIRVVAPKRLRKIIYKKYQTSLERYDKGWEEHERE
ncbi:MAG: WYL domain-containing protein [Chitinophagales bacterium]|nr:WYL domain-containing protein [Chitinophagales bacterium]